MTTLTPAIDSQGVPRQNLYTPVIDGLLSFDAGSEWQAIDVTGTTWENLDSFAVRLYGPSGGRTNMIRWAIGPTSPTTNNNLELDGNDHTELLAVKPGDFVWYKRIGNSNQTFTALAYI